MNILMTLGYIADIVIVLYVMCVGLLAFNYYVKQWSKDE